MGELMMASVANVSSARLSIALHLSPPSLTLYSPPSLSFFLILLRLIGLRSVTWSQLGKQAWRSSGEDGAST